MKPLCALAALAFVSQMLVAQSRVSEWQCARGATTAPLPGGVVIEHQRATTIRAGTAWSLTRRATDAARAAMLADSSDAPIRFAAVLPEFLVTSQSAIPLPANDGPMWAGKGLSYSVSGGVAICGKRARWGAIIAPTYWYAENAQFDVTDNARIIPQRRSDYSRWASPYHYLPRSLDNPRRFGDATLKRFEPGTTAFWYRNDVIEAGLTTESEWWGPGQYNALLLSSQAAGVARVYVQTAKPIRAKGDLELRYFLGAPRISPFHFDQPEDSSRTLAGLVATWRPEFERGLTFGAARLVASPRLGNTWLKHLIDPILPAGTPNAVSFDDKNHYPGRDQLFSVFANWRLPEDGTELWLEWGRAELPRNLRDALESPNHTQALTIGLQHVQPFGTSPWTWRIGAEYSQTNQSSTYRERPIGSWYTSRAVQGGFTQNGQILGAAIGPGSVTQRVSLDFARPSASVGLFLYRIKWDEDAFYTIPRPNGNALCKHDVSLAGGIRGVLGTRAGWFEGTVTTQNRLNLYWQALGFCFQNEELQIDQRNLSIEFRFRPRAR
jgi:hypothetical protein